MYHIKNIYFVLYITDKYNSKLVKKTTTKKQSLLLILRMGWK